jgi:hypothetical protein
MFMEDGKCGIYAVRPWICRSFYVATPAENCSDIRAPIKMLSVAAASGAYFALLKEISEKALLPYGAIPQMLAMRWAKAWIAGGVKALADVVQEDVGTPAGVA